MGIASYNRGTRALSRDIDAAQRPVELEIMDRLNALPKYADAGKPFGPIQFVHDSIHGGFWAQDPAKGSAGFGFWYSTLGEAVRRWRVQIVAFECGVWRAA